MDTTSIIFFGTMILLVIIVIIVLIKKINNNRKLALSIKPSRYLSSTDIDAIKYLEIDSNLTVNLLLNPTLPKREIEKSVWSFLNIDFVISSVYKSKRIIHHFYLSINGQVIEVIIPEIFLPYLTEGQHYTNKTIEILYRREFFVLFSVSDEISYPLLHQKFKLGDIANVDFIAKRSVTKEDKVALMFSKWTSVWGLLMPVLLPMFILIIISEGVGISVVFVPFILLIAIPFKSAYKKRTNYVNTRFVYKLRGTIWFDENTYKYKFNDVELKLHRKYKKAIKKNNLPINDAEVEVILHTYDTLNMVAKQFFQPISIKSSKLNINEKTHKSTRDWFLPTLYLIAFGFIVFLAPLPQNQYHGHIIVNSFEDVKSPYIFPVITTLIWWSSIVVSIYLLKMIVLRIKENYFSNN